MLTYRRRINTVLKGRQRSSLLVWGGTVLTCRTNHLTARMIWRKLFRKTSILGGCRDLVWCGVNQPIFQSIHFAIILFILFFKSSWCKIASAARNCPAPKQQRRPLPSLLNLSVKSVRTFYSTGGSFKIIGSFWKQDGKM